MESELLSILQNFGIQVVMLLWFMFRFEKIINHNTEAIHDLNRTVIDFANRRP